MTDRTRLQKPIAIVGVSALFPGSSDAGGFWRDILAGRDLITDVPPSHWLIEDYYDPDPTAPDKTYAKRGAFLSPIDFDPLQFGVPPSIVPATDTAQLLALIVAQQVLEDAAQGQFAKMDRERISVILGVTSAQELLGSMVSRLQRPVWTKALRESGIPESEVATICERIASNYVPWQESSFPGLLGNVVAGRIANRFDLRGTNAVTDAACASALAALSMAVHELALGESDLAITGGVDTLNDIFMYMCFSKTPALSPTGDCRPFSDGADGTMLGEGMGMLALKRLEDAERDGDRVYAVIRAIGSASDGRSKSVYAPVPEGQARALRRAYEGAGYGPETVELVEAHGTGTKAGDLAEFEGLRLTFEESGKQERQWCALGSVKSQIGHTKAAAGAAGLFKAVMALHHKTLPPTIKVAQPNPKLEISTSPFYLNTQKRPWIRDDAHPRRASVSSFGFGGSNFHVALEEYTPHAGGKPAWRLRSAPSELVLLAADTKAALATLCRQLTASLKAESADLIDVARRTQLAFSAKDAVRVSIIAATTDDLAQKLEQAAASLASSTDETFSAPSGIYWSAARQDGELAYLFPGQGSQYVGMGADVAMGFDQARGVWDRAASIRFDGAAVHEVVFPRPVFSDSERAEQTNRLTSTEWAQPALGLTSLALVEVLSALGLSPSCVAGHSFGEVTALCAAGVISGEDLVRLARRRGELMRDASATPGAMTAVSCRIEELGTLLAHAGGDVCIANHNAPTQVVLSGSLAGITAMESALSSAGLTAKRLPVATAFHSNLVAPSSAPFRAYLDSVVFSAPRLDVYGNTEAAPYPHEPVAMRALLSNQLARSVRFVEQIEAMYARGVRTFVEVGAGSVLTELVSRILADRPHHAIALDRKGRHGVTSVQHALGRLSAAGHTLDLAPLWALYAPANETPKPKPKMALALNGSNYGKPYPPQGGAAALPPPNPARAPIAVAEQGPARAPLAVAEQGAPPAFPITHPPLEANDASMTSTSPDVQLAWVQAFQDAQRQTAEAHAAVQRSMADSHAAFLRATEASFAGLTAILTGSAPASAEALPALVAPSRASPENLTATAPRPPAAPSIRPPQVVAAAVGAPVPTPPPAKGPGVDLERLMLEVVAEKTGYPAEMLGLQMDLEADLGVDSIKRVEILALMRERAPGLGEVKPAELASLRTLGQIVEYMRAQGGVVEGAPAAQTKAALPSPAKAPGRSLEQLMLEVVAEKTGYPAEMLALTMDLEADLGVDSIKRVEILALMRERAPGLGEVKPAELASLRTLGQIVEYMRAQGGVSEAAPMGGGVALGSPVREGPALDLERLMLEVVAEKTGYPAEMLGLTMDLEADLGVDSIKRVEILALMRERAPGLGEVKPAELASLRTLGQIVTYMQAQSPGQAVTGVTPVKGVPAASRAQSALSRFAVREVAATPVGMGLCGITAGGRVVVTDDGAGIARALVSKLGQRGVPAELVNEVPADADVVLFLGGLGSVDSVDAAVAINRAAFAAARAVATRFGQQGGTFVCVQDTGGDFGLSGGDSTRAWLGGLAALVRTAALEWPKAALKAIDCARAGRTPDAIADALVVELLSGGATLEVGLHADGTRTTLRSVLSAVDPSQVSRVNHQSVIVASGGARGVTAATLIALANAHQPSIVLLGRTALSDEPAACAGIHDEPGLKRAVMQDAKREARTVSPAEIGATVAAVQASREVRATLEALRAAGSHAEYVAVDVQNAAALAAALVEVRRRLGPITGIVHGAGVLADKRIEDKTDEQFNRVFDTKVKGLRALLDATKDDPINVLALFSSIAARTGNAGQCDYAMANEVLNLVANAERARRGASCVVRAIGWGPWEGGMVTPTLAEHFKQRGVPMIPIEAGARAFVHELDGNSADTQVVIGSDPGDGALGATANPSISLEVRVDHRSHPELRDHMVAGVPVLPVVMALEWFVRAAKACHPDLTLTSIESLKVLRGVKLDHYERGGDTFVVRGLGLTSGATTTLSLELRGRGDALHYTATAVLHSGAVQPPLSAVLPDLDHKGPSKVYDGHTLFHGKAFQVIKAIEGVSREGLVGTLSGTRDRGWASGELLTDPAALDGALQLAVLWTSHVLGGASLPMAIGAFRTYSAGTFDGPLRCVVRAKQAHDSRAVCNLMLLGADGIVVAELLGIETVLRPEHAGATVSRRA